MADFTAKDVQALRQVTGAGMMDAKKALTETDGDMDAARKLLREKGLAKADDRAGRENAQGAIAIATNVGTVGLVELKCETDFVAKSDNFIRLTQQLADSVAAQGESGVAAHQNAIDDLKVTLKENIEVGGVVQIKLSEGETVDTYLHRQDGRGVNGVVVVLQGGTPELAHDLAVHIAFAKPQYLTRDEVPEDLVAEERRGQARGRLAEDRRGPPHRLVQRARARRPAVRPRRQADRGPARRGPPGHDRPFRPALHRRVRPVPATPSGVAGKGTDR
jgi:elongation factor Ts